ncbi:Alpha-D-glucose-1-phosphate phosphatase YihX [Streptomyces lavendulae subsp. lavendulae]|uniref:Alpha-D-glucose-1-phosphate phosphatase YihX n=1 Tax=Streptomyces lavendulae subsp. lavendulae TaxID=58340 RepID=A0A2K8PKF5_STRLA|nr:HAD family phosphatase [Streptomyces lavendulae]ATZ26948.1 Alpha-D-glucose-1-phosphate phosphatase YihX [Streptomyces lavendulae subsp. lavendulae]QUQ56775.1 Phosphoglycolate phosphatase [Streptomyces lavendulae subsp. lavendulae]
MTTSLAPGPTRPFDAVLCDVDNVIRFYDSTRLGALERAAGLPEGTTAGVGFTPALDGPLLLGRVTLRQWAGLVADALGAEAGVTAGQARELADALAGSPFSADAEVVSLLRRARAAGLTLVLVTNATVDLESDLARMGLAELADHVVSSARVGVAKPDREIYEIALDRAGAAPERCLFVDDLRENVEAARALGMTGLHYRGPADLREALGLPA